MGRGKYNNKHIHELAHRMKTKQITENFFIALRQLAAKKNKQCNTHTDMDMLEEVCMRSGNSHCFGSVVCIFLRMHACILCVYCVPIVSGVVIFSHHDQVTVFV